MVSHDVDAKGEQVTKSERCEEKSALRQRFYPDKDFRTFREGRCASN